MATKTHKADALPDAEGTILGLAQAPLHMHNLVAELVDNALAASKAMPTPARVKVRMILDKESTDLFHFEVEDAGAGASLDLLKTKVFRLGGRSNTGSHLNEHGFGLKNVLAKIQVLGKADWEFFTRDDAAAKRQTYYYCRRPLDFQMQIEERDDGGFPLGSPTGTLVRFCVPLSFVQTVAKGKGGARPQDAGKLIAYLKEHLGVMYRGFLEGGRASKEEILLSLDGGEPEHVTPVGPHFLHRKSMTLRLNIGGHKFEAPGEVGLIDKGSEQTRQRLYYYRHAPESQGIDVRVGDRVVATQLITEVWGRERHPSLNGVAGEFKIPVVPGATPPTLNNKVSLNFDSREWIAIAEAIQSECPESQLPSGGGKLEDDLRDELLVQIEGLKASGDVVQKQFDTGGVLVDIVWEHAGGGIDIYEVKKGKSQPLDVYQLVMYWDSLVDIGKQPTRASLVSDGHTPQVEATLRRVTNRKDANGKPYAIVLDDWKKHAITV